MWASRGRRNGPQVSGEAGGLNRHPGMVLPVFVCLARTCVPYTQASAQPAPLAGKPYRGACFTRSPCDVCARPRRVCGSRGTRSRPARCRRGRGTWSSATTSWRGCGRPTTRASPFSCSKRKIRLTRSTRMTTTRPAGICPPCGTRDNGPGSGPAGRSSRSTARTVGSRTGTTSSATHPGAPACNASAGLPCA